MDIDAAGTVWFGCQHEGPATERPPLVGKARMRGKELQLLDMPDDVLGGFRNYIGSVAANRDAGTVAVSSPQGNALAVIDAATGKVVSSQRARPKSAAWRLTATASCHDRHAAQIVEPDGETAAIDDYVWDNHVLRIELSDGYSNRRRQRRRTAIALRSTATKRSPASSR